MSSASLNPSYLVEVLPVVKRIRIPVSRDQAMLLMIAVNEIFLGIETYLAHSISGTIVAREWVPILFGPVAGILLLVAGVLALRHRMLANLLATITFVASIAVGLVGSYFHYVRAILPNAEMGFQINLPLLVWAPPLLGPITFALVGILGLSAAWQEDPVDSGRLVLPGGGHLQMPLSKTRAYFFLIGLGTLITVISSVLDHARSGFVSPWVWIPTVVGLFGTVVIVLLGVFETPTRADLMAYLVTMGVLIGTGVLGSILHISHDLTSQNQIVMERFLRGAPVLAPMLFANMGAFGVILLLDSREPGTTISVDSEISD